MLEQLAIIRSKKSGPYLYFIVKGNYVYIGETQRYPFNRWQEHFLDNGTFLSKLLVADPELAERNIDVDVGCIWLSEVEAACSPSKVKSTTKYIEHMVHLELFKNHLMYSRYTIISDTSRTAPTRCEMINAVSLAEKAANLIISTLASRT